MLRTGVVALGAAVIVMGTLAIGIAAAPSALAQSANQTSNDRPVRDGRRGPPMKMLALALDLTDAQQEQIKAIFDGHRPDFDDIRNRARTARQAVRQAVVSDEVNEQAIRSAVTARAQVEADGAILRARIRKEVQAVLTPEQRANAEAFRKVMPGRFGPHMRSFGGL
jgi:Spy/CpxP family protein refolding chaperone